MESGRLSGVKVGQIDVCLLPTAAGWQNVLLSKDAIFTFPTHLFTAEAIPATGHSGERSAAGWRVSSWGLASPLALGHRCRVAT